MKNHLPDFVKKRFKVSLDDLPEVEHRIVQHLGERRHISRDINLEFEKKLTPGERLADRVAAFGGSWTFIIIFAAKGQRSAAGAKCANWAAPNHSNTRY